MSQPKDFMEAVEILKAQGNIGIIENQQSNNVELSIKLAQALVSKMSVKEKVYLQSGHWSVVQDLIKSKGRVYNAYAINGGGCKRLGVPSIRFSDGPRGVVMGKSTCFPTATVRAAAFDSDLEREIGKAIAKECIAQNANYFAGICINLLRHPAWGRAQESYGEDQYLLGKMGAALTKAVQDYGIIACPKHYALNSIENLRFSVSANCDDETLYDVYLPHFKACIDAGAGSIMGAYNRVNGVYACESKRLLKDILRDEWGFKGFTISDFVWGVRDGAKSLENGMNIEMPLTIKRGYFLKRAIKKGEIKIETIDESCIEIISTMLRFYPLIENQSYDKSVISCKEHTTLARKAMEKGAVLLKNENALPLIEDKAIAVVGRYADTINIGDKGSSRVFPPYVITLAQGLKGTYSKVNVENSACLDKCAKAAEGCESVIVVSGYDFHDEGEYIVNNKRKKQVLGRGGDRVNLSLPQCDIDLITLLNKQGKKVIVVIYAGSATIIEEWKDKAHAIIFAGYPGMEGGRALANIISGKVNPSGKLPFTIAKKASDYPPFLYAKDNRDEIEYGYYHGYALFEKNNIEAAFPFGFGLSYTTFEYKNLKVKQDEDKIEISVNVKNTGKIEGEEITQIYVGSNLKNKPLKLLKGFCRTFLQPGEEKTLNFSLSVKEIALYDKDMNKFIISNNLSIYAGGCSLNNSLLTEDISI